LQANGLHHTSCNNQVHGQKRFVFGYAVVQPTRA
jgi:hypothetical protein